MANQLKVWFNAQVRENPSTCYVYKQQLIISAANNLTSIRIGMSRTLAIKYGGHHISIFLENDHAVGKTHLMIL